MGCTLLVGFLLQQHFNPYNQLVLNWYIVICRLQRSVCAHTHAHTCPPSTRKAIGELRRKERLCLGSECPDSRKPNHSKASSFLRLQSSSWKFRLRKARVCTHTHTLTHRLTLTPAPGNPRHSVAYSNIPQYMNSKDSLRTPHTLTLRVLVSLFWWW